MERDNEGRILYLEYWIDGRKFSRVEKQWFDLLFKYRFFVPTTFTGKKCSVCQTELGHWHQGLQEGKSYVAVVSYGSTCVLCYNKQRHKKSEIEWTLKSSIGVQPENPKPRTCSGCGRDCNLDNCDVMIRHGKSYYQPPLYSGSIRMEEFDLLDLILEQRVEYMLHWCDPENREEGFRKADVILLGLFEGFNPDKEMKLAFTEQDEYRWRVFCNSKRNKKERVAWDKHEWRYFLRVCQRIDLCSGLSMAWIGQLGNIDRLTSDGEYRLGGCIYIPVGLNFGKELLEDLRPRSYSKEAI
ncbi:hypothetical protein KVV02_000798 [Mortierella alpina]|uniref:Uncharacterized protein n=1 Tax=Mortierella alpina TaxID=64518 RepID=A0A9P7ZXR3_MORAP|nr:hypothetical protein KVV02_000798 [Mortierella alpina]